MNHETWQTAEIKHPRWLLAGWLTGCALIVMGGLGVLWLLVMMWVAVT